MARRKKDDTSEMSRRVNITLKLSQIEWLRKQGGVSATIQKLINEKVNKMMITGDLHKLSNLEQDDKIYASFKDGRFEACNFHAYNRILGFLYIKTE